ALMCVRLSKESCAMRWKCADCGRTVEFDDEKSLTARDKVLLVCDCSEVYEVIYPSQKLQPLGPSDPWRRRMLEAHRRNQAPSTGANQPEVTWPQSVQGRR